MRGAGMSLAGAAVVVLAWAGGVSGYSQLVMEQTFQMDTSTCEGVSCRREIIGANETLGVGAVMDCSPKKTYWHGALATAPKDLEWDSLESLFELVYSCRKDSSEGEMILMSWEECGMVEEPCLDAGTNPHTSEVTYQMAFEFKSDVRLAYDVTVDVKLYFNYLRADEAFYTLRSHNAPLCLMSESCHRSCNPGELQFMVELGDTMGDGWNAGGVNLFDHFKLDSDKELLAEGTAPLLPSDAEAEATLAAARRTSYKNTMLGGSSRRLPLCLADGEYLFTTEYQPSPTTGVYGAFSIGGRQTYESNWTFCGASGMLSDYQHVRVGGGDCVAISEWGGEVEPGTTPVPGVTVAPTPAPADGDDGGENRDIGGGEEGGSESAAIEPEAPLTDLQIFAIGFGALMLAGAAAAGGTYAQNKGWFGGAAAAGAGGAAAAGGGQPNPDSDEFAP